jgi:uncharacterized SAM-binding protein YcdF (DUF218 family)
MISFFYDLKGQATVLNGIAILLFFAFILNRYKKRKLATFLLSFSILIFIVCSTSYLPEYLAKKLENKYLPLNLPVNTIDTEKVIIHVLGSGYNLDKRLPANSQIGLCGLGRLAEGIRIHRALKSSIILCSGYSSLGLETQAQVTKRAAIVLGVNPAEIETLNTPSTTQEEASDLAGNYGKNVKLVIVTDAMHMSRAIKIFKMQGFFPIAAPTNYNIKEGPNQEGMRWWPSSGNLGLMNYVIHEYLGDLKVILFG